MRGSKFIPIVILAIVVGGFLIWAAVRQNDDDNLGSNNGNGEIDTSRWDTYTNEAFGFSLKHPPSWRVAEFPDNEIQPAFNIYKPGTASGEPPFIHHSDVVHVSVFPRGVPTEGIFGESLITNVNFTEDVRQAVDFVLDNGEKWATMATFATPQNQEWNESGFIFAAATVDDLSTRCLREGEEISMETCDQFTGDEILRDGEVDSEERAIEVAILESFQFIEGTSSVGTNLIRIDDPAPNDTIESALVVRGEARGNWYFEASFPIDVVDAERRILGRGFAMAQGEWMTTNFAPFQGTITFTKPTSTPSAGFVIFHKDNPSGLPENDASVEVPVRFTE